MLPKVATHLLHTTSRAAAAVQNQTYTIRNVLQLQSTSAPSGPTGLSPWNGPGNSHWGSNGPGPGSAKHQAGSRFHGGYTGAGRAVTQANTITSYDNISSDETDETRCIPLRTTPSRLRSHSLTMNMQARNERGETLGVLKTVQLHARSRHAFAQPAAEENQLSRRLVRRNSTSAPQSPSTAHAEPLVDSIDLPPSPLPSPSSSSRLSTDPAAPQTVIPPVPGPSTAYLSLRSARDSADPVQATQAAREFLHLTQSPSIREFNMALDALYSTRRAGEPLQLILEIYNAMLSHSLLPNIRTYSILIHAFTDRDHEIQGLASALELRIKRRSLTTGSGITSTVSADTNRMVGLRAENNFESAMSIFQALLSLSTDNSRFPLSVYTSLLRACAQHANVPSAIHVFAQLEKHKDNRIPAIAYRYMIQTYKNANQLSGAEEIFAEFLRTCEDGTIEWNTTKDEDAPRRAQLQVWNQMIEAYFQFGMADKAIGLVDKMLNAPSELTPRSRYPPHPSSSTFTTILSGFCGMGDVSTAVTWFDRLLLEQDRAPANPYEGRSSATRPDSVAWAVIIDALAMNGMTSELNRLFNTLATDISKRDGIEIKTSDRTLVFDANLAGLANSSATEAKAILLFLEDEVMVDVMPKEVVRGLWEAYLDRQMYPEAIRVFSSFIGAHTRRLQETGAGANQREILKKLYRNMSTSISAALDIGIEPLLEMARIGEMLGVDMMLRQALQLLHVYGVAKSHGQISIDEISWRDCELLLNAAVRADGADHSHIPSYAFGGLGFLLEDFVRLDQTTLGQFHPTLVKQTIETVTRGTSAEEAHQLFTALGGEFLSAFKTSISELAISEHASISSESSLQSSYYQESQSSLQSPQSSIASSPVLDHNHPRSLVVDSHQTRMIDEVLLRKPGPGYSPRASTFEALKRFQHGISQGKAPHPLGRLGEMNQVQELYETAQHVLTSLELNKKWQAEAWFGIEDSMIIALAHSGGIETAHIHRTRMLDQGGAPTADAYGALILYVKDTTDDTSNAMTLFNESQARGVVPNQYLYNNIISKLSKARKADYALELFQQMKANRVNPSSITYGAVIGACARVGDVHSAEILFSEMVQARNFKPRVPPYNTMMQLYTTTKPNRERALFFYEQLRAASVAPTAHTFKLLMDAYGIIEPVDVMSMEQVFQTLQRDKSVEIQGTHFASLINAYGCVQKDLEKAIAIFDSIPSYKRAQPVDAVVFEAMINVLVAHRRTDLMPEYISKMSAAGVHMTAYIANFLLKGYSIVGDLEQARAIFESLADPPEGMAAPNNHAPHEPGNSPIVNLMEPVYREPSTWEAMVRAELGAGHRDRALQLLERLKTRKYPDAVYNRISGIMVDHSMVLP
ncbi:hypothetical protein BD779DRAFT_1747482 [Infundibulicybe gibba]|nr:hypothetical protein BD779DRAFT_1747482 [Infundibulicybe gibba]